MNPAATWPPHAAPTTAAPASATPSQPEPARWARLSIVIPALNEEESIGSTIQRCLDARDHIRRVGRVADVEIVVVSDGSTDRTAEIAQGYAERESAVSVIVFPKNRGYGAALKEGFRQATGDLLGFLDADGTCDPRYFADLCQVMDTASIALGSRLQPGNRMPLVRRVGNRIYALLLGLLSGRAVTDTASGMRVLRREALNDLYPLPDGMHFTPAMSARALLSDLRITEVPMAYAERVGESKLNVLRDGVRFLVAIFNALLLYRPSRLFGLLAAACVVVGMFWGLYPVEFYLHNRRLEEWMIYRVLLCAFLFTTAYLLCAAGVLSERILALVYRRRWQTFAGQMFRGLFSPFALGLTAAAALAGSVYLAWPGLVEYLRTGHTQLHWSRAILAAFLLQLVVLNLVLGVLQRVLALWKQQLDYASRNAEPQRV